MRVLSFIVLALPLPFALAQCSSNSSPGAYNSISGISGTTGCMPDGYSQAVDAGNTTPDTLASVCAAQCGQRPTCTAYVGQLFKAADSNLYTGQCFLYTTPPTAPRQCDGGPMLIAGTKDTSLSCLSSSAAAASSYCSSVLRISVVTVYTSTSTPTAFATTSSTTTNSVFVTSRTTTSTSTTSTISRTTRVTSTSTSLIVQTITSTSTTTTTSTTPAAAVGKRIVTNAPAPACLTTAPASRIISACSCLSLSTSTTYLVSTAATSTSTITRPVRVATTSTTSTTKTETVKTVTTTFSTSVISQIVRQGTTTTAVSTSVSVIYTVAPSPTCGLLGNVADFNANMISALFTNNRDSCYAQCIGASGCKSWQYSESSKYCSWYSKSLTELGFTATTASRNTWYDIGCNFAPPPAVCGVRGQVSSQGESINHEASVSQTTTSLDLCRAKCLSSDYSASCISYYWNSANSRCQIYNEYAVWMLFTADPSSTRTFSEVRCP